VARVTWPLNFSASHATNSKNLKLGTSNLTQFDTFCNSLLLTKQVTKMRLNVYFVVYFVKQKSLAGIRYALWRVPSSLLIYLFIWCLSIFYLSLYPSIYLSVHLFIYVPFYVINYFLSYLLNSWLIGRESRTCCVQHMSAESGGECAGWLRTVGRGTGRRGWRW